MKSKSSSIRMEMNGLNNDSSFYPFIKGTIIIISFLLASCSKLIEVDAPVTSINQDNVYASDATAISALTGIYSQMSISDFGGSLTGVNSISLLLGLSADELTLHNEVTHPRYIAYYKNALIASRTESFGSEHWSRLYNYIFECNAAIEGIESSKSLTIPVRSQLLGEAKFLRAFFYFYLVNLFGDVPLALSTDPVVNSHLSRSSKSAVYRTIIDDLEEAYGLLSAEYLSGNLKADNSNMERLRPTKWAASALLARVYLYTGEYSKAEVEAARVISSSLFDLTSLNDVFLKNSREAIWQLQPIRSDYNTEDALTFILPFTGPSDVDEAFGNPVYLSSNILNSFESGDHRRIGGNWIDSVVVGSVLYYYPFKYKSAEQYSPVTEYLMVIRVAEQYLIRAESRAQQGNIAGAQADLNAIRNRAGLANTTVNDKVLLVAEIFHERQVELFTEWGHRWMDMKRTGKVDALMSIVTSQKGGNWNTNQQLYPILFDDIATNPNLTQNAGY